MKLALAALCVSLGGCYLELGLGAGRTVGPHVESETEWVLTVSAGADFSKPTYRTTQGGSVDWTGAGNVQPESIGLTLGGDVRVAGDGKSQTRLSGRVTPATISWVEDASGERGYVVPVYLGVSRTFDCNDRMQCAHVGVGVDSSIFHRSEYGYGAFVGPQFRISTSTGLLEHLRSSTGKAP